MNCCGSQIQIGRAIPATGSASEQYYPLSGMTKGGFCIKCFSFWFFVALAVVVIFELGKKS